MSARARLSYGEVPAAVRGWVEQQLGSPVVAVSEQDGGMSPGCVSRLRCANGSRAFVRAVGSTLNRDSPALFRREITALELIGSDPRWALRASYDDGTWVALLLEDVEGRNPDLADPEELAAVLAAVDDLGTTLTARVPAPPAPEDGPWPGTGGLLDLAAVMRTWAESFEHVVAEPDDLPSWLGERAADLRPGVAALGGTPGDRVVHQDIRADNLLVRRDGTVVVVDWGGCGVGQAWTDPLLARLGRAEDPWFDRSLSTSPGLVGLGPALEETITSFLVAFGCHLAWRSRTATDVNLPKLADFRRQESRRALAGAARRLDA